MSKIVIDVSSCVRFRSIKSECVACAVVCELAAIEFVDGGIKILNAKCTECFACISVCPSAAVISSSAGILGFSSFFLDSDECELSCDSCGFCVKAFDAETLLSLLVLKKQDIVIVQNGCEKCTNDDQKSFLDTLNIYAKGFGIEHKFVSKVAQIQKVNDSKTVDRRGFLAVITGKNILKAAKSINDASKDDSFFGLESVDFARLREKNITARREGLLGALTTCQVKDTELIPLFFTDKYIDKSCTNCELCYNLCPSGALSSPRLKNAINFESSKCIKCKLCEDVCETKSIHSLPTVNLLDFAKKTKKELIRFKVAKCYSCGAIFTPSDENDGGCPRCTLEDEDALDLSGFSQA
jgi:energy-converting hydrogenase A subunit P